LVYYNFKERNMMKRTFIFIGIGFVLTFLMLYVLNKVISKTDTIEYFTEAKQGEFVIAVNVIGELAAEKSVEIKGPSFAQSRYVRSRHIKILDLVPEGTMIRKGDYIATLDRTDLENTSKDLNDRLKTLRTNYDMKKLDTAVALSSLRNGIKNQNYVIEEAAINRSISKYEAPSIIRRAEIELNKSRRKLEQQKRSYMRSMAQGKNDLKNQAYFISIILQRVNEIEQLIAGFTITSPENGMVMYKRERLGNKRKIGSTISPFDRVVAILPDLSSMISKTYVSEIDIRKIQVGQKAMVTIDALPKKIYSGTVFAIANIGEGLPNFLNFNHKILNLKNS
jgi:HlyD family secretion protein